MNQWSSYFNSLHNNNKIKIDKKFSKRICDKLETSLRSQTADLNFDIEFENKEILDGIKSLKNNKASGLDAIKNEMIKISCDNQMPFICELYNRILTAEMYPEHGQRVTLSLSTKRETRTIHQITGVLQSVVVSANYFLY